MAISINTQNPADLLIEIKKAIDDKVIDTWSYDKDGDFTHTAESLRDQAWLESEVSTVLKFKILGKSGEKMSSSLYASYHGRFSQMLLAHFKHEIYSITLT